MADDDPSFGDMIEDTAYRTRETIEGWIGDVAWPLLTVLGVTIVGLVFVAPEIRRLSA